MTDTRPYTWRTKWITGKLIANFRSEEMARLMFEMGEKSYPGEIILEPIPQNEEREYGRDAEEAE